MKQEYMVGDIVETKKDHPCGSREWQIIRVGADYKMKCLGCGRIIMLSYTDFIHKIKRIVKKNGQT